MIDLWKNEPLEFQLDCAEDELVLIERSIDKLIQDLYAAQINKGATIRKIESLEYDLENQVSA